MSRGFRQSSAGLHTWSGLIVGWLLFAIALAGTASVFRSEIGAWMRPEIATQAAPDKAIEAAVAWLKREHPQSQGWYLTAPDDRSPSVQAAFDSKSAPDGYLNIALDPISGSPEGIRDTLGGEFLYRFHFQLQLPYPWGRMLAAAAAMLMLITLISGIIIHARIFKDYFTLRPGKGKRSWLDAHNVLGVLALPFHLMISATGVVTLLTLVMPWGIAANYGEDAATAFAELSPGFVSRAPAGTPATLAPVGPMLAEAQRHFSGGRIGRVSIANPGDANAIVTVSRHDGDQLGYGGSMATFEGATGRLISTYTEARPAKQAYDVLYGLHMGRFAPEVSRWLYFLCGLALTATIATGLVLWLTARAGKQGIRHKLVARLNVGAVAGMPIAILAMFWANRLLPLDITDRDGAEVSVFFWAWGLAILFAFLRPPRRGWIESMGVAAIAAALLPPVSFALTGRGLWTAAMAGDWLFLVFDLVMFAFASSFAAIAWKVGVHRSRAPRRRAIIAAPAAA